MMGIDKLIVRDMVKAYFSTLSHLRSFELTERDMCEFWASEHKHEVAHRDLCHALFNFTPAASIRIDEHTIVQADEDGCLHFRSWTTRPHDPMAISCN